MTQLESFSRRGFRTILEEAGLDEDQIERALPRCIEHGWAIRQFNVNAPAERPKWMHPAIQMVKRITGQRVPAGAMDAVIEIVGDSPDEVEYKRAYSDWAFKKQNDLHNLTWLKWARPNQKPKAPTQAKTDPFAALRAAGLMGD